MKDARLTLGKLELDCHLRQPLELAAGWSRGSRSASRAHRGTRLPRSHARPNLPIHWDGTESRAEKLVDKKSGDGHLLLHRKRDPDFAIYGRVVDHESSVKQAVRELGRPGIKVPRVENAWIAIGWRRGRVHRSLGIGSGRRPRFDFGFIANRSVGKNAVLSHRHYSEQYHGQKAEHVVAHKIPRPNPGFIS